MTELLTFFDAFLAALGRAADYNKGDQTPPAAVLWTDKDRQWEPLLPRLRAALPLLTLGPYDPTARRSRHLAPVHDRPDAARGRLAAR